MFANARIGSICFFVSDPARTETFYRDVLGLEVMNMGDDGSGSFWLSAQTQGGVELIFFRMDARVGGSPVIVFDLAESGIDTRIAELQTRGAAIVSPVTEAPGGWSAEIADPDGHVISMFQSEELPRR